MSRLQPLNRPLGVAALAVTFYLLFVLVAMVRHDWDPLWFVWIGERYAELDPDGRLGYDGQFVYYMARDGADAAVRLGNAPYRAQRVLLPALVRLFSGGSPALIPWVTVAVNLVAVGLATHLLAAWLREKSVSPWYGLLFPLFVGTFMSFSRGLNEPLAFALAAAGAVFWQREQRGAALLALSLAFLAKETTLLFLFGIGAAHLFRWDIRGGLRLLPSLIPFLIWQGVLYINLGAIPIIAGPSLEMLPLIGILPHVTSEPGRLSALLFVGLPALLLLGLSIYFLIRERGQSPTGWWLFLHALFAVLLPLNVYDHIMHAGRNTTGLVVALVFLLPAVGRPVRLGAVGAWAAPTLVWLIPVLRWAPWLSTI